ncbi:FecR domain-containing protein [Longitalea luteola]|uniref:FecR domain-containing protein n=1 Tax=Longitalea luteola TaxID=2812563 RepID=UPI001A9653A9|nr:FecR domain-containing protein [Longitalea luteola]
MNQSNFDRLLQQYLAGECTSAEEKLVLEWYETLTRNSDLHLSEAERSQIEARLWKNLRGKLQDQAEPVHRKSVTARLWYRVVAAAAFLIMIATAIILYRQQPTKNGSLATIAKQAGYDSLTNRTDQVRLVLLADSTKITLQPGAIIYYPPVFTGTTREIYLKGSAFFNVYHDEKKHFKVHLNDGLTTEVLGTSFQITQHTTNPDIEVAVVTGKVLVYKQQASENTIEQDASTGVVLTPNKKVTFNAASKQLITGLVADPQPLSKTNKQPGTASQPVKEPFVFEEAALQQVVETLSYAYGILITVENEQLGRRHFTGDLSTYSLFTQLEYICRSTQTFYEINGTQIIIKETRTGDL